MSISVYTSAHHCGWADGKIVEIASQIHMAFARRTQLDDDGVVVQDVDSILCSDGWILDGWRLGPCGCAYACHQQYN